MHNILVIKTKRDPYQDHLFFLTCLNRFHGVRKNTKIKQNTKGIKNKVQESDYTVKQCDLPLSYIC